MEKKTILWYTRHQGSIKGPFTSVIVTNNITLGRLAMHDEVSTDQKNWHFVRNRPELHPGNDELNKEKAKKNLDERDGFDRRNPQPEETIIASQQRKEDRRLQENDDDIQHRRPHTLLMQKFRQQKEYLFWPLISVFSILTISTFLAVSFPTEIPVPFANCSAPAMPEVNWNNCLKPKLNLQDQDLSNSQLRNSRLVGSNLMNITLTGADLAYADLRFTNLNYSQLQNSILLGANLRKADLSYADLTNADLSYTDLTGANLGGSVLTNTRFDHAIWPNGQLCAPRSIGQCIAIEK